MAAVSDSMYKPHSPAIYVSSNAYYGYIPPCSATQNKFEYVVGFRELTNRGCEMEIDEDCSSRLNSRNEPNHRFLEQHQQATSQINVLQHRNRKRCNADQTSYSQQKKFREEAVVTTTFSMVQEVPRTLDWPRCIMKRHDYC